LVARLAVVLALAAVVVLTGVLTRSALAQATAVDFSYAPAAPTAGEPVTFTSTSSLARPIVRESWDFNGDGRFDVTGHVVTSTFMSPGAHTVTLQVQTDRGRVRSTSKLVTVLGAAPAPTDPPPAPPASPPAPATPAPAPPAPASPPAPARPPTAPVPAPTTGSTTGTPAAPTTIAPFPIVRIAGSYSPRGVRLRLFAVTAPGGVRITVRCQGRGCPYRKRGPFVVRSTATRPTGAARHVSIGGFRGRLLKPGVRIEVFVAHPQQIGKYTRFTIRRGHSPLRTDSCLRPTGTVFSCR
jgi:hypothetical protein